MVIVPRPIGAKADVFISLLDAKDADFAGPVVKHNLCGHTAKCILTWHTRNPVLIVSNGDQQKCFLKEICDFRLIFAGSQRGVQVMLWLLCAGRERRTVAAAETKHSHNVREETRSDCHTDMSDTFPNTHTHWSPGCWSQVPAEFTLHAVKINDCQKAQKGKVDKECQNSKEESTTQQGRFGGSRSLISPGDVIPFQRSTCCKDQARPEAARLSTQWSPPFRLTLLKVRQAG